MKKNSTANFKNTFQCYNEWADEYCRVLPSDAFKILIIVSRKILGFQEHRRTLRDQISLSQIQKLTGLSRPTVIKYMKMFCDAGVVTKTQKNDKRGQEYRLNRKNIDLSNFIKLSESRSTYEKNHSKILSLKRKEKQSSNGKHGEPDNLLVNPVNQSGKLGEPALVKPVNTQNHSLNQSLNQHSNEANGKNRNVNFNTLEELKAVHGNNQKVDFCFRLARETDDERFSGLLLRLGDVILRLHGHGASDDSIDNSMDWLIKVSHRCDQDVIEQTFSRFKEIGIVRNPGGLFTKTVKEIASIRGINLKKKPMMKAPAWTDHRERKVA